MKPVCHFMLLATLLLGACQSRHPSQPVETVAPTSSIKPPASLGHWTLQGNISRGDELAVYRYTNPADNHDVINVSVYPLPSGWQRFGKEQALLRHFGTMVQEFASNAQENYQASRVDMTHQPLYVDQSGTPVIDSRFVSTFPDDSQRVTLISLTLLRQHFVRLSVTTTPDKANDLAANLPRLHRALAQAMR